MLNQIIVACVGMAILGGAYLIDLLVGVIKVSFTPDLKWSWKKMGQDFVKAVLWGASVVGFVAMLNLAQWYGALAGADLSFLGDASFPILIGGILGGIGWYLSGAGKNIIVFIKNKVPVEIDPSKTDYDAIVDKVKEIAYLVFTKKEAVDAHKDFEEEGGQGASYAVPITTYDAFRNAVIGKAFDIDGCYGAQCWDGAALLWQQLGRSLSTGGTGAAKGCWTVSRAANAGNDFDLVANFADLKRGDVIVFGYGTYGHIAFVDNVNPLRILGQNQMGTGTGAPFNVINATSNGFLGAFRLKRWNTGSPAPNPTPTPYPDPKPQPAAPTVPNSPTDSGIKTGDSVIAWGVGTGDSYGGGAKTHDYQETVMRVIGINNGHYALNQYNAGIIGYVSDTTGWWPADRVRKA